MSTENTLIEKIKAKSLVETNKLNKQILVNSILKYEYSKKLIKNDENEIIECCEYVNNRDKFKLLLDQYENSKLYIHQLKKRLGRNCYEYEQAINNELFLKNLRDSKIGYLNKEIDKYKLNAANVRSELKKYWPCEKCISEFNPTKRLKVKFD